MPRPPSAPDAECPACGGAALVGGTLDGRTSNAFRPDGLRFWTLGPLAAPIDRQRAPAPVSHASIVGPFGALAHACVDCGLVWMHVDPARLRAVLETSAKPSVQAALGAEAPSDRTPGASRGDD